jgi:hypothetical protein
VALLRLVRSRSQGRDVPALLDALVVTIGLGVVSWQFLMVPYAPRPVAVARPEADLGPAPVDDRGGRPGRGGDAPAARWRLVLLGGAAILAPTVQMLEWLRGRPIDVPVVAAGSIVMFLLIVARTRG